MNQFDAVIVGAGAAGLFCAGVASQLGLKILVIDHNRKIAEKIRISGGGRCNFTNRDIDVRSPHKHYLGNNPQFCRSALSKYTPQDFIDLMQRHNIAYEEKHKGQLFCKNSAQDIIDMLIKECEGTNGGNVTFWNPCSVQSVSYLKDSIAEKNTYHRYEIATDRGLIFTHSLAQ
jgi:predicted flavoprotein YhiN